MARMMADCPRWPSEMNCSLVIIGEEDEVVQAAAEHAASVHGREQRGAAHRAARLPRAGGSVHA